MTAKDHQGDAAFWAAYAQGVRKIGSAAEEPAPAKPKPGAEKRVPPKPEAPPAPLPPESKALSPRLLSDAVPEAWRERILQEEGLAPLKPPAPVEDRRPEPAPEPPSEPPPVLAPAPWKREPLDLRVERNLSLGDVMVEAKLDLHGKTEAQAHELLNGFIEKQRALGRRLVLVVTGRGREGDSVLRANLPRWCDVPPLAEALQAVRIAAPHHGGEGAYYLLLRKKNS